jgi:hypothetical protein
MSTAPQLPPVAPAATALVRADGTWFDAGPGVLSGYLGAAGYDLGLTDSRDRTTLYPGDYVEVRQDVDLTGYDLASLVAAVTGLVVPMGLEQPGYLSDADTLLHYRMDEVSVGARDEVAWQHDLRPDGGPVGMAVPTYNAGYGLARTWGAGAGSLAGVADPAVIPAGGLAAYTVDWWQAFDVDAIATSNGVSPVIFQLRSVTAGGLRMRWLGTGGMGAHSWQLQVEHWAGGVRSAQAAAATLRAANLGNEFFSVSFDDVALTARVYRNGALLATTAPLAHAPGATLAAARLQVGDPLYRGMIDDLRLSEVDRGLAGHQAAYATRLNAPAAYAVRWLLEVRIDGEVYATCEVTPDAVARPTYLNAPVFHVPGVHTVSCRLALGAA